MTHRMPAAERTAGGGAQPLSLAADAFDGGRWKGTEPSGSVPKDIPLDVTGFSPVLLGLILSWLSGINPALRVAQNSGELALGQGCQRVIVAPTYRRRPPIGCIQALE